MIRKTAFGVIGKEGVFLYHLSNQNGDICSISNYGGIITSWTAADKNGTRKNITIGFNSLDKYLPNEPNFGALIGRYANRIANGRFVIDDVAYQLNLNEGRNQLHGGHHNFTKAVWHAAVDEAYNTLVLLLESPDGSEGYPGDIRVQVSFHLSEDNELSIHYEAVTDKPTHINLTSHPYFNLSGDFSKDILGHELQIMADAYTPVNNEGIPTGAIEPVAGTAYDFLHQKAIGRDIHAVNGYDNNYVLNNREPKVSLAAILTDPGSGRSLEVYTDQPGLQLYTSNGLDGSLKDDEGQALTAYAAVCLETQHFPDTPNHHNFPSTLLRPGQIFQSITRYKAGLR